MKFATVALIGAVSAHEVTREVESTYLSYIAEHGKSYGTEEEFKFRLNTFSRNLKFIDQFNAKVAEGEATVAINHMADWTHSEYKKLLGYRTRIGSKKGLAQNATVTDVPASVDWRALGAVTPVKN